MSIDLDKVREMYNAAASGEWYTEDGPTVVMLNSRDGDEDGWLADFGWAPGQDTAAAFCAYIHGILPAFITELEQTRAALSDAAQMVWEQGNFDTDAPLSERIAQVCTEYQRQLEQAKAALAAAEERAAGWERECNDSSRAAQIAYNRLAAQVEAMAGLLREVLPLVNEQVDWDSERGIRWMTATRAALAQPKEESSCA